MSKLLHSYRFINQPYNHTLNITLAEQQFKAAITYKTSIDYYLNVPLSLARSRCSRYNEFKYTWQDMFKSNVKITIS